MLIAVLLFAAGLAGASDKGFQPFILGDKLPRPAAAAAFNLVRDGMTLKELVDLLGPGHIHRCSGIGTLMWSCEDGRALEVGHTTDPKVVLTGKVTPGRRDQVRITMRDRNRKQVVLPGNGN